jgi:outer membrane protein assembly factor BamB
LFPTKKEIEMNATWIRRGTASLALCAVGLFAVLSVSAVQAVTLTATLSGGQEVPANGSISSGTTVVNVDPGTGVLSWSTTSSLPVTSATGHHIHQGAAGVNGPVVVNFSNAYNGTVTISTALAAQIAFSPRNFYVNLHTAAFPGGEIRGQLIANPVITPTLSTPMLIALGLAVLAFGAMVFRRKNRI